MQQAFNNGELDFIMAPPILLAEHIGRDKLADGFVGTSTDGSEYGVALLVRQDQHINQLNQASGKRLILPENDALAQVFLDSLIIKTFKQHYQQVFSRIMTKKRQSEVVLALFFNQADVGIADKGIYHLMVEMNPQIQDSLEVLTSFPSKSPNYGYFHYTFPEWLRNKITQKVSELNDQPRSQQILNDLRMASLVPCSVDELRVFDDLISEYRSLKNAIKK
jgi:phosphonate transport system substrate-binding protein